MFSKRAFLWSRMNFVSHSLSTTATQGVPAEEVVRSLVLKHDVVVFSKSYCPYCQKAKKALTDIGVPFFSIELDEVPEGNAIQDALLAWTGQRTVPNIFVKQVHIGGCDKTLAAIASGKLQQLLK